MTAVVHRSAPAAELHGRPVDGVSARELWWLDATRPAVVLGSRQRPDLLDRGRVEADGLDVVVRRSGGGAVLVEPGRMVWVDVLVPATDPLWREDVTAAMVAVGERWAEALADLVDGAVAVHRGRLERSPWADLVCFEGLGPGEVVLDGRKLVGISQRRTRAVARFQCAVHLEYEAARLDRYLAPPVPAGPRRQVAAVAAEPAAVVERVAAALR